MTTPKKVLKIDALRARVVGWIELEDGTQHDVLPMTFATHQGLDAADAKDSVKAVRAAVHQVVPTLTDEQIGNLDLDVGQQILTLAGAGIEAVERMFPNAVRPEGAQTSPA